MSAAAGTRAMMASPRRALLLLAAAGRRTLATTASGSEPVLVEQVAPNGVATWTLNRPKARNALSLALLQELRAAQERLLAPKAAAAPTPRVVVVRSTGAVFSSGHDLKELAAMSAADQARVMALCSQVMAGFRALPQPVLAAVDGLATAAGCQLVASCDLVLATRAARFATPGVNIGLFCSTPGVALARAVLPQHAMKMLLTGEPVSAAEAAVMGLVAELVEDAAALDAAVDRIASLLAGKSRATLALGKRVFYQQIAQPTLQQAYETASAAMVDNLGYADAKEGIRAFLDKRSPTWRDA